MVLKKWFFRIGIAAPCVLCIYILLSLFAFSSYVVPTPSMMPTIMPGDRILVEKLTTGPRFFSLTEAIRHGNITRLGDCSSIKRNDIIVFNFPFPKGWKHIRFNYMKFYAKRCIALPGDTLVIHESKNYVMGLTDTLGNMNAQILLSRMTRDSLRAERYGLPMRTFPRDRQLGWDLREFGPMYIPRSGDQIEMTHLNFLLYGKLIEWETNKGIEEKEDGRIVLSDSTELKSYTFDQNYYFVCGDNAVDSQDSRYWGLVPEEFIAGKALMVWYSYDKFLGRTRWERIGTWLEN
ncbi:MAG: signal peptidase I [Marinilabiliaceae bacterium]|nr:signal peptidase I [Marinilabiliaceae bacterium]